LLFTGKDELTIDAKHRLAIPAKVRAKLDPQRVGAGFYGLVGPNGAIWLWPERTFEQMAGEIEATLAPHRAVMDFDEVTFPDAEHLEIDGAGRVRVPGEMLAAAELGSRVLVLGMRNHLEVWDPDRWRQRHAEKSTSREEIVERAGPLLGHGPDKGKRKE